jgi:hypothetical protein
VTDQVKADEVAVKKIPGFVAKPRLMEYEVAFEAEEGAAPFVFQAYGNLTIQECDDLTAMLREGASYQAFWERLAWRVKSWNAVALDLATNEYVPVPPPAEVGIDAFRVIDPALTSLIALALIRRVVGRDSNRPKAFGDTPGQASDGD